MRFRNLFHPYLFLREVFPKDPEAVYFIVLTNELEAQECQDELAALGSLLKIELPGLAFLPDTDSAQRLVALDRLARGEVKIILAASPALSRKTLALRSLEAARFNIGVDQKISREELIARLIQLGLRRADFVESVGEFAARGQALDFFTAQTKNPIRVIFEYDRIESIRFYDIATQESVKLISSVQIVGVSEGQEVFAWELAGQNYFFVLASEDLGQDLPLDKSFIFGAHGADSLEASVVFNPVYQGNISLFLEEAKRLKDKGYAAIVASRTFGEDERLKELIAAQGGSQKLDFKFLISDLSRGFQDEEKRFAVFSAGEIFAKTQTRVTRAPSVFKRGARGTKSYYQRVLIELKIGDIVVHEIYGIARYLGLKEIHSQEGVFLGEMLCLEFAKKDKLYVPIEDFHFINKYVALGSQKAPKLSSLDKRSFELVKNRVREEIEVFCRELLKLYGERQGQPGVSMPGGHHWEDEFAQSFGFEETPDQAKAIEATLADMESVKPMERLILGDVGYGKTEVALRAAFRAVINGKQAAFLAPTTILAEQHFRTLTERFRSYPVRFALLTRFQTKGQVKRSLKDLSQGLIDIAVGTHRLIQKDVTFKNLRLLVIDEEHRFGVKDKERLKFLAAQVDTLYLSATPIPRTLSAALGGLKDISIIESAPVGRLRVETSVGPWDRDLAARAMVYELGREGQVFYVLNDIKRLPQIRQDIEAMAPGARAAICHGQMAARDIESVMEKFLHKEIDVLVASSIIESGLDIPSVNTLIIEEAQNFGLSQLYQIRGRIGRGRVKAYCYFFYPRGLKWEALSAQAKERLKAIEEFAELGSAIRLSLRDLEIRGSGEILGTRQHGFVSRVGLELYTKLLNQEMEKAKNPQTPPSEGEWPKVSLNFPAYLSREFMPSETERIAYYRRLSQCESETELEAIYKELEDRCGRLPQEVLNLKTLFQIRLSARSFGVSHLEEIEPGIIRFEFKSTKDSRGQLIAWLLDNFKDRLKFESSKNAFRLSQLSNPDDILSFLEKIPE